jgi:hypothetical protein
VFVKFYFKLCQNKDQRKKCPFIRNKKGGTENQIKAQTKIPIKEETKHQ